MLATPSVLPSWQQLVRRAVPQVIEASIVPAAIMLVFLHVASATVAIAAALAWVVAATLWRVATRRQVSGLSVLSITRLFVRSAIAIVAGSTFVYFVQGAIGGFCLAVAWLVSVAIDRPLARRFAGDFCNLRAHVLHHPRVHHSLRRISLLWGLVGLVHAAVGLWLLVTLSTGVYVVVNALLSVAVPAVALAVSVTWFRRTVLSIPDSTVRPVQIRACEAAPR
jgi:Protein of unknown function (DUF3159)